MRVLVVTEALQNKKKFGAQHTGRLRLAKQLATDQWTTAQVNSQCLTHQTLGRRQRTRCAPVSFSHGQQTYGVTVSQGLTELTDEDVALDSLYARADAAMYQAKRQGKNQIVRG